MQFLDNGHQQLDCIVDQRCFGLNTQFNPSPQSRYRNAILQGIRGGVGIFLESYLNMIHMVGHSTLSFGAFVPVVHGGGHLKTARIHKPDCGYVCANEFQLGKVQGVSVDGGYQVVLD